MKTFIVAFTFLFCSFSILSKSTKNTLQRSDKLNVLPSIPMDNKRLDKIIKANCEITNSQLGFWEVKYKGYSLTIITDEAHNRMRIVCPVIEEKKLTKKDLSIILSANFDSALDAKYALYKEYLWSVFTHPLKELEQEQFKDAMLQVATLTSTYGSTYTSTDLIFGGSK